MRSRSRAVALSLLCAVGVVLPAVTDDRVPPAILVVPAEAAAHDGPVGIAARIRDSSGVSRAAAWVVTGVAGHSERIPMVMTGAESWQATVRAETHRGDAVRYWIEAADRLGNVGHAGSALNPFIARIVPPPPNASPDAARSPLVLGSSAAVVACALVVLLIVKRRRDRRLEVEFWTETLSPITRLPREARARALDELCSMPVRHPLRGYVRARPGEARHWLSVVSDRVPPVTREVQLELGASREPGQDRGRDAAGNRTRTAIPVATTPQAPNHQTGVTLIELLIALALLLLLLGIGVTSLSGVEAPVELAADKLSAVMREARSLAMLRTTAHRVRPSGLQEVVVEVADDGCGAVVWTQDERLGTTFEAPVALGSNTWSVCFNARGIASTDTSIQLVHPERPGRSVEILAGGAVRRQTGA